MREFPFTFACFTTEEEIGKGFSGDVGTECLIY